MEVQTQNKGTQSFLLLFAILLFFLGLYIGRTIWYVNPEERVAQIVSCEGYEDNFLKEMGFQNRDSCVELNLALHRQYIDDCLKDIKSSSNESHDKKLLDLCVHHSFEKQAISLSSEYLLYRQKNKE